MTPKHHRRGCQASPLKELSAVHRWPLVIVALGGVSASDVVPPRTFGPGIIANLASGPTPGEAGSCMLSLPGAMLTAKGPRGQGEVRACGCPKPLQMSRDVLIFVEEAADAVVSLDLVALGRRTVGERP